MHLINQEMYMINVVFMPANTTPILLSLDQGVILNLKSYWLRNILTKSIDNDSSDGSGQSQLKIFWKVVTILDAIMNIGDSWEEVKTVTGIWKKVIPALMNNFEG